MLIRIWLKILMRIRIQIRGGGGWGRSAKNVHPPWQNPRYAPAWIHVKFGSLELDPHWGKKLDPDPQLNQYGSTTLISSEGMAHLIPYETDEVQGVGVATTKQAQGQCGNLKNPGKT